MRFFLPKLVEFELVFNVDNISLVTVDKFVTIVLPLMIEIVSFLPVVTSSFYLITLKKHF